MTSKKLSEANPRPCLLKDTQAWLLMIQSTKTGAELERLRTTFAALCVLNSRCSICRSALTPTLDWRTLNHAKKIRKQAQRA